MSNNPSSSNPPWLLRRRTFVASGAAWLLSCTSLVRADEPRLFRRGAHRVQPLCSLPPADYQHGARSPSTIVRSQLAISLTRPELVTQAIAAIRQSIPTESIDTAVLTRGLPLEDLDGAMVPRLQQIAVRDQVQSVINAASTPQAKLILMSERELSVMHCEISDVVVFIEANGLWHLSLRADQNPKNRRNDQQRNIELQIKRNAFRVQVRLLHSSRAPGEAQSQVSLAATAINQAGKLTVAHLEIDEFWVEREAPAFIKRQGYDPAIAQHFQFIDQAEVEFFIRLDPLTGNGRGVVEPWQRQP